MRPVLGAPVAVPCRLQILLHLEESHIVGGVLCVVKLSPQRLLRNVVGRLRRDAVPWAWDRT
jgi:hypothetical protein